MKFIQPISSLLHSTREGIPGGNFSFLLIWIRKSISQKFPESFYFYYQFSLDIFFACPLIPNATLSYKGIEQLIAHSSSLLRKTSILLFLFADCISGVNPTRIFSFLLIFLNSSLDSHFPFPFLFEWINCPSENVISKFPVSPASLIGVNSTFRNQLK